MRIGARLTQKRYSRHFLRKAELINLKIKVIIEATWAY